jgi:hypothetical protein
LCQTANLHTINNSSLFTVTLYSSAIPTPVYNDTQHSVPSVTLKPSSAVLRILWRRYCDVAIPYLCCQADECHESSSSFNLKQKRNYCQVLKQARAINQSYGKKGLIGPVLHVLFWNWMLHNSDCYGRRKGAAGTHVRVGVYIRKYVVFIPLHVDRLGVNV